MKIKNIRHELLSNNWGSLKKYSYDYENNDRSWSRQEREVYDRGDGATILLYNTQTNKIILTEQFRIPTFLNKNPDGILTEACAGKLEVNEDPNECVIREVLEEAGYQIPSAKKVFEAYMSPGSVTEIIHFFIAPYDESMKVSEGGGQVSEQENITVREIDFDQAILDLKMNRIKDAKTMLLLQYIWVNKILVTKVGSEK